MSVLIQIAVKEENILLKNLLLLSDKNIIYDSKNIELSKQTIYDKNDSKFDIKLSYKNKDYNNFKNKFYLKINNINNESSLFIKVNLGFEGLTWSKIFTNNILKDLIDQKSIKNPFNLFQFIKNKISCNEYLNLKLIIFNNDISKLEIEYFISENLKETILIPLDLEKKLNMEYLFDMNKKLLKRQNNTEDKIINLSKIVLPLNQLININEKLLLENNFKKNNKLINTSIENQSLIICEIEKLSEAQKALNVFISFAFAIILLIHFFLIIL